jgi:hypothetical protein
MKSFFRTLLCAVLSAPVLSAQAGFFIPKDTTMVMGMYSPDAHTVEAMHGLSRSLSIAAGHHRYKSDDGSKDRRFTTVQAAYLVNRSFYSDGVSNLYVFGGPVLAKSDELVDDKFGIQAGVWADYETRRIYVRASVQRHDAGKVEQTVTTGQALWAPYAADYEDIATWFGVQLQRRTQLSDETQITPMVRFYQRTWWVDAGASVNSEHRGDIYLNVMLLF